MVLRVGAIALALAVVVLPGVASPQIDDWLFRIAMLTILATSWNLLANAGLISLGHSAFWGVGAYAAVLGSVRLGLTILPSLLLSLIAGALLGVILAFATGRLRDLFFAICTLALSEGLRTAALMLPGITGGAVGLFVPQDLRPTPTGLYTIGAAAMVVTIAIAAWFARTRYQYACRAMRSHEGAAQMLGVNPMRTRILVLALSGALAACAGGINAWRGGYLEPNTAFDLFITVQAQIAPIFGGLFTVTGPVIGAVVITALSDATRLALGSHLGVSTLVFGLVLVVAVLTMPRGLYGSLRRLRGKAAN
jgi:branched-chain amino acid transport system permease protein